ncbi:MAG TPA: SRPBCC domain-containing protein [Drouetiella sp.]
MEGSLAILGFWLFMIVLILKKPIAMWIEKSKPAPDKQTESKLQNFEVILHAMAKDLGEIKQLLQAQNTGKDLLELKSALKEIATDSDDSESVDSDEGADKSDSDHDDNSGIELVVRNPDAAASDEDEVDYVDERDDLGSVVDATTIKFERILPGSVEQIWKYISEPELLNQWLCTSARIEPKHHARVEYEFEQEAVSNFIGCARIRGLVSNVDHHSRLCHSWIDSGADVDSEVSYELEAVGDNETKLVVTHSRVPSNKMAEYLSAWHVWLDNLWRRLRGVVPFEDAPTTKLLLPVYSAIVLAAAISSAPAQARLSDQDYQTVKAERKVLLDKFDVHWHKADSLEREIFDLKRDNSRESDDRANQLSKSLDDEHRDLRKLELDIRDLDKVLI